MTTCLAVFLIPGAWRIKSRTLQNDDSCTCTLCIGTPQRPTSIIHVCGKCTRKIIFSYLVRCDFEPSCTVYSRMIQFTCVSTGRLVRPIKLAKYPRMDKQTKFHSTSTRQQPKITLIWNYKPRTNIKQENIDRIHLPRIIRLIQPVDIVHNPSGCAYVQAPTLIAVQPISMRPSV